MTDDSPTHKSLYGHIARFKGYLPLNGTDVSSPSPMGTHGGALSSLVRVRSSTSIHKDRDRRTSSSFVPSSVEDEESWIDHNGPKSTDHHRPRSASKQLHYISDDPYKAHMDRRASEVLMTPQMRSMRLIGNSNPRYKWERYWKTEDQLKAMTKPLRGYYERCNSLIQQYLYIDRLLDSSLPHDLLNEYSDAHALGQQIQVPTTITEHEEEEIPPPPNNTLSKKVNRTPRELYRVQTANETSPLLQDDDDEHYDGPKPEIPGMEDDSVESGDKIVQVAIYVNLLANTALLAGKLVVILLTSSLSVLASLVDAALDFLSTAIVWTTARMIARQDQYMYPVGRRRLEPIGVLVFSVIMVTSFFQVALECFNRLNSSSREIVNLGLPAITIMASTVVIKAACWVWCRLIKNSSVQALAQDAQTDVVFNIFSIIFPIVGYYAQLWWLDALGGLLLSLFVIMNWAETSAQHIRNLTGAAATADERNVLLYLTMRFAKTVKHIQGLSAYHSGDKLNVEVDIVLDESTSLRDSHDLGESLQYVLESVPNVDRAWVHMDYLPYNLPTHLEQQPNV